MTNFAGRTCRHTRSRTIFTAVLKLFTVFIVWLSLLSTAQAGRPKIKTSHPPITAILLGQTGEDLVGTRTLGADGVPDVHVRLNGVSGTISKIRITGLD